MIGRLLHIVCGDATIVPDYKKRTGGVAIARSGRFELAGDWDALGKFRLSQSAAYAGIMCSMAGKEAELIQFNSHLVGGDRTDGINIALYPAWLHRKGERRR